MKIEMIRFKVPADCIVCGKHEDSSENMLALNLREFKGEHLQALPAKYLGKFVHKKRCVTTLFEMSKNKS
jgi:hypothetical protein